jgi:F0F1-type ATP synthase epsilon subunit
MEKFKFELVGIDGTFLEENVDVLTCKTALGEISILANHHPLITVAQKGEVKVKINDQSKSYLLPFDSILEVKENRARLLVMFPL